MDPQKTGFILPTYFFRINVGYLIRSFMRTVPFNKIQQSFFMLATLCGAQICSPVFAQAPTSVETPSPIVNSQEPSMSQEELEARGKALRKAIDAKYQEIEAPGGPFANPPPGQKVELIRTVYVTDLVLQYLPIGMSLADAQTLLKAGGFSVRITGPQDPKNHLSPERNAGVSGYLKLVADLYWFTNFGINARSNAPDGQNIVIVEASFFKQRH